MTQFGGVLNDNLYKLAMAFLLIDALGAQHASTILSAAGAIFVIPFILFSNAAGVLADRISKQRLIMSMKVFEVVIMLLAIVSFAFKSVWGSYSLLFLLATQSAFFGPSKYGIIPELVEKKKISRANGLITSFTYLAIIFGTFLAAFLSSVTDRKFTVVAIFCLLIAILGFIASFGIRVTEPQGGKKRVNPFFISEIFKTLKSVKSKRHLLPAIFGSAFFFFIGAYTQLNIIPFAIQSLGLSEIAGGYLFLVTAIGIALGSFLSGRVSKLRIELGLSCIAGFFLALIFFFLFFFSSNLTMTIISLALLGLFGGMFVVPFDSFIQVKSDDEQRGQVIAAANWLSFVGVLFASLTLYLLSNILHLSSATGFALMGIITLIATLALTNILFDLVIPFIAEHLLKPFLGVEIENPELLDDHPTLIIRRANWSKLLRLLSVVPTVKLFLPDEKKDLLLSIPGTGHAFLKLDYDNIPSSKEKTYCFITDHPLKDLSLSKRHTLLVQFHGKKTIKLVKP